MYEAPIIGSFFPHTLWYFKMTMIFFIDFAQEWLVPSAKIHPFFIENSYQKHSKNTIRTDLEIPMRVFRHILGFSDNRALGSCSSSSDPSLAAASATQIFDKRPQQGMICAARNLADWCEKAVCRLFFGGYQIPWNPMKWYYIHLTQGFFWGYQMRWKSSAISAYRNPAGVRGHRKK